MLFSLVVTTRIAGNFLLVLTETQNWNKVGGKSDLWGTKSWKMLLPIEKQVMFLVSYLVLLGKLLHFGLAVSQALKN